MKRYYLHSNDTITVKQGYKLVVNNSDEYTGTFNVRGLYNMDAMMAVLRDSEDEIVDRFILCGLDEEPVE